MKLIASAEEKQDNARRVIRPSLMTTQQNVHYRIKDIVQKKKER
ncbi:hypothetical protein [Gorillibacterium massiliense]|nr:hypothetical protein [Gorillibacterium massiliense]